MPWGYLAPKVARSRLSFRPWPASGFLRRRKPKPLNDAVHHAHRAPGDGDDHRSLVGPRFLERGELALEQRRRHEVILAGPEPPTDQGHGALKIDQSHAFPSTDDAAAVGALQCRAGDDAGLAGRAARVDPLCYRGEPGPAVFILERNAAAHLGNVGRRMEAVGVSELPTEPLG